MTKATQKEDWLNEILAQNADTYVSDSPKTANILGLPGCEVSIRFIGNTRINYSLFCVVKTNSPRVSEELIFLLNQLKQYSRITPFVIFQLEGHDYHFAFSSDCGNSAIEFMDDGSLAEKFSEINSEFSTDEQ